MSKETRAPSRSHRTKVEEVGLQVRRMGAQSVLTSKAVAARFGLHSTELEALDLVFMQQRVTAGELAKATGLTTGAVTALIDRLEESGYVERVADPLDRRKVMVQVRPNAIAEIQSFYEAMQRRMFALWSEYSENELDTIADFLSRSTDLAVECLANAPTGSLTFSPRARRKPHPPQSPPPRSRSRG